MNVFFPALQAAIWISLVTPVLAAPVVLPSYEGVEEVSEYENAPWFSEVSLVRRRNTDRLGPKEAHVENPPGLDDRREAILDALRNADPSAFFELASSPETGESSLKVRDFHHFAALFEPTRDQAFRTLREHPLISESKPGQIWCRHQWMTLPDDLTLKPKRGNLHLFFDASDLSLKDVWFNPFPESGISLLPKPDKSIENDPALDRGVAIRSDKPDRTYPPDYSSYEENSEFLGHRKVSSMSRRNNADTVGITEAHVFNPEGLDERREAIIDALWKDDEIAFLELAVSPSTGKGGLRNQKFQDISREISRYRREGIRTMRSHPIDPDKDRDDHRSIWCRHQWMTMPENESRTPARGNLNLIFDSEDLSLSFVRFHPFERPPSVSVLPYPDPSIPNDPVRDRAATEKS